MSENVVIGSLKRRSSLRLRQNNDIQLKRAKKHVDSTQVRHTLLIPSLYNQRPKDAKGFATLPYDDETIIRELTDSYQEKIMPLNMVTISEQLRTSLNDTSISIFKCFLNN